jgi:SAM-dependent methyltransferase
MYPTFEQLIELGLAQELNGWDFSWLNRRTSEEPLPWDYERIARSRMAGAEAVLDIDTGGGELYSRLGPFPMVAWATEGYAPNVGIARARLEPLGIQVADTSEISGLLPFVDNTFDLVLNRHGGLYAMELERVMHPGGWFITQQVGGENCIELNRALQEEVSFVYSHCTLEYTVAQLEQAGLQIIQAREVFPQLTFQDIAGVAFYLKAIPWQIADFSVEKYHEPLLRIHETIVQTGGFSIREHRLLIEAVKPQ